MDWDRIYEPLPRRVDMPGERVVETCWRIRVPGGRVLTCTIVLDAAPGLDVRAGFTADDVIRSHRVAEIDSARELAEQWRRVALEKSGCQQVSG
jgi:hypothetical protein